VSCKLEALFAGLVDLRENHSAIPVAAASDLASFIHNQDGLVKLLDASIDLIDAILCAH